ncbi:MAG: 2-oxoglutarate ferredoxin oxidoreductase subunit gamma [Desulfococcus sp. 4484_241]|nr:MAG: 2-oxoglutarate ferredoxin oxidoreductase subunit gamma [Desulfococcus sp. 4484_241]
MARTRFIFSGAGGQGVITAAVILGEAAALHEGLNAVQAQSYGPEARGGASRAELIISDDVINFPRVNNANVLVCLTQEAYNRYYPHIRPGGLLVTDSKLVTPLSKVDARQVPLPLFKTAMETVGEPVTLNICMLGAVVAITGIVKNGSVEKVIETRIPGEFLEVNRKAFSLGYELGLPHAG